MLTTKASGAMDDQILQHAGGLNKLKQPSKQHQGQGKSSSSSSSSSNSKSIVPDSDSGSDTGMLDFTDDVQKQQKDAMEEAEKQANYNKKANKVLPAARHRRNREKKRTRGKGKKKSQKDTLTEYEKRSLKETKKENKLLTKLLKGDKPPKKSGGGKTAGTFLKKTTRRLKNMMAMETIDKKMHDKLIYEAIQKSMDMSNTDSEPDSEPESDSDSDSESDSDSDSNSGSDDERPRKKRKKFKKEQKKINGGFFEGEEDG